MEEIPRRSGGRPSRLSADRRDQVLFALRRGNHRSNAAQMAEEGRLLSKAVEALLAPEILALGCRGGDGLLDLVLWNHAVNFFLARLELVRAVVNHAHEMGRLDTRVDQLATDCRIQLAAPRVEANEREAERAREEPSARPTRPGGGT